MNFFKAAVIVLVWQGILVTLYHFGEVDRFWFIALEMPSAIATLAILAAGWAMSLDWG